MQTFSQNLSIINMLVFKVVIDIIYNIISISTLNTNIFIILDFPEKVYILKKYFKKRIFIKNHV